MKTKNLTIQEAIQSGLPFKRPHNSMYSVASDFKCFQLDEVMATDWQIEVPEVTITREKLAEAWDRQLLGMSFFVCPSSKSNIFAALAKELGL